MSDEINKQTDEITRYDSFETMDLKENILRGVFSYGFEHPSEIQSKAIVPIISGSDVIAQSQSGTGKTGTFVISTLQRMDETIEGCQAIIVAPTRELAQQIVTVAQSIGSYLNINTVMCVGGSNIQKSRDELKKGNVLVVGTPGRIIDMIDRGYLQTRFVKILVMDEADEMLSSSFLTQIRDIVCKVPTNAQICLFSATMPREVMNITKKFMNDPKIILVKKEQLTLEGIKQFYINVDKDQWKFDTFCDIYDVISVSQSIVYVNSKNRADWLKDQLEQKHFTVSVIHSRMRPIERAGIMRDFRSGSTRVLVSTDLLARGIDVQQVSVVINYDLPNNKECYLHRIGRSGRFGRKGVAINLVTQHDFWKIEELEKFYSTSVEAMPLNISDYL